MVVRPRRSAVAAAEFAIALPFLAFLVLIIIDFSRVFSCSTIVDNCACNGALYASDPSTWPESPYQNVTEAATADAVNLSPTPTVTSSTGVDDDGYSYVEVTVA